MVGVFKTHENRQIVVHTRGIQRRGVFYRELRVKGAELCERLGVLFTGKDPCEEPHCAPVR